jgi:metal-responsive CopG/Arc/MetJ family transcriptional regulator
MMFHGKKGMGEKEMRTTINLPDHLVREMEAVYHAESRSKAIEQAITDALQMKRMDQLREFIGQIEFDEQAISEAREQRRA